MSKSSEPGRGGNDAPEAVPSRDPERFSDFDGSQHSNLKSAPSLPPTRYRTCGLSPLRFWLLVLVLVLILSGGLAGGVFGGLASRNRTLRQTDASQSKSAAPISTNTRSQSVVTPASLLAAATTGVIIASTTASGCNPSQFAGSSGSPTINISGTLAAPTNNADSGGAYRVNGTSLVYKIHCMTNIADNLVGSPNNEDIYTLQLISNIWDMATCITLCASYNDAYTGADTFSGISWGQLCSAALWVNPWDGTAPYCELHNGNTEDSTPIAFDGEIDTAILQIGGSLVGP